MNKKRYARVANGAVMELFETTGDISAMFNHELLWIDVTDVTGIAYGWIYDGSCFTAPMPAVSQLPTP